MEDSKNEPGAADFYYGEMEMRRLAAREHRRTGPRQTAEERKDVTQRQPPPLAERWLLHAYWAVSGYGLRASRALTALVLVLIASAALFTHTSFARLPPPADRVTAVDVRTGTVTYGPTPDPHQKTSHIVGQPAPRFAVSLDFVARESLSLLRVSGSPALNTTGLGTLLDVFVRLLALLLLGLALLAVRGRTKR